MIKVLDRKFHVNCLTEIGLAIQVKNHIVN